MAGTVAGYAVTVIPTRAGAFIGVAEVAGVVEAAEVVAVVVDSSPSSKNKKGPHP